MLSRPAPVPSAGQLDLKVCARVAMEAATSAGRLLRENLGKAVRIEFKGALDLVTEMDKRAESLIVETIKKTFPDHGILTEESDEELSDAPFRWIIDPLDGTTNYAHGYPVFSVSIGLEASGEVVLGVVYEPVLDELFFARRGAGAFLNGRRIRVSKTPRLDTSLLATGFPYDIRTSRETNLDHFSNLVVRAQAIRRAGSAAMDLCHVACSRFDGFWEMKLKPWDMAAGALMVEEAGGVVTDFSGGASFFASGEVLATNGLIHDEMKRVLGARGAIDRGP